MTATRTMTDDGKGPYRVWECILCGYVYDEAEGDDLADLPPGTRWEDISDDWVCPDCGAAKSSFDMRLKS
jgi:rubredoxin